MIIAGVWDMIWTSVAVSVGSETLFCLVSSTLALNPLYLPTLGLVFMQIVTIWSVGKIFAALIGGGFPPQNFDIPLIGGGTVTQSP